MCTPGHRPGSSGQPGICQVRVCKIYGLGLKRHFNNLPERIGLTALSYVLGRNGAVQGRRSVVIGIGEALQLLLLLLLCSPNTPPTPRRLRHGRHCGHRLHHLHATSLTSAPLVTSAPAVGSPLSPSPHLARARVPSSVWKPLPPQTASRYVRSLASRLEVGRDSITPEAPGRGATLPCLRLLGACSLPSYF